jgi:hypothetical protein
MEITDYQKGLVDAIAATIGLILDECEPELKRRVLEKLNLQKVNPKSKVCQSTK